MKHLLETDVDKLIMTAIKIVLLLCVIIGGLVWHLR